MSIIRRINFINTASGICHFDTIDSPGDGHVAVRSMWRRKISICEKNYASSWLFTKNVEEMHTMWGKY